MGLKHGNVNNGLERERKKETSADLILDQIYSLLDIRALAKVILPSQIFRD